MVYLVEVDEETGPFSYIEKSNRWVYDEVQSVFGRAITTGSYCCDKQSRSAVFQLPEFLKPEELFTKNYAYFSSTSLSWCRHAELFVEHAQKKLNLNKKFFQETL